MRDGVREHLDGDLAAEIRIARAIADTTHPDLRGDFVRAEASTWGEGHGLQWIIRAGRCQRASGVLALGRRDATSKVGLWRSRSPVVRIAHMAPAARIVNWNGKDCVPRRCGAAQDVVDLRALLRVLGLFVGLEFVNQPHSLLNDAIDNVSNISAFSVGEVLNLILQLRVEIDWKPECGPLPVKLPALSSRKIVFFLHGFCFS